MGQSESQAHGANYQYSQIASSSFSHVSSQRQHSPCIYDVDMSVKFPVKGDCEGTWSLAYPDDHSVVPSARTGQVSVYDDVNDQLWILYGEGTSGCLNDCWTLSLQTGVWTQRTCTLLPPRARSGSVLVGRELFIFGGTCDGQYFSDLHSFNLDTGIVTLWDSGCVSPRCRSVMFHSQTTLFIWGGFNGSTLNCFHALDFASRQWSHVDHIGYAGRPGAVVVKFAENDFLIFGDTTGHPLLRFDATDATFKMMTCTGVAPPPQVKDAQVAVCGEYLLVFGGEKESPYTYIYALDVAREAWFPFCVMPDGETVTLTDGNIKSGFFQLPRQHSSSVVYSLRTRSVVTVMGNKLLEPPPIHMIAMGRAMGVLHLKDDMLDMLLL